MESARRLCPTRDLNEVTTNELPIFSYFDGVSSVNFNSKRAVTKRESPRKAGASALQIEDRYTSEESAHNRNKF